MREIKGEKKGMGKVIAADTMLRVAVSTRALFDLEKENEIFERDGAEAYIAYQMAHEHEVLPKGPAFAIIEALLALNKQQVQQKKRVEILIMSRNSAEVSLRIFHSIAAYGLDITRASFTTGQSIVPYLTAFHTDLYLSADENDVAAATREGIAAGLIMTDGIHMTEPITEIRIAFDGDAVLFSDEAERVFQTEGVEAFCASEQKKARSPLKKGPFAHFLETVSALQREFPQDKMPIRTALVTARCAPAHERVIRTLRSWDIRIDEAFFLGGEDKSEVLRAFGAHIFFDDNAAFIEKASKVVLSARVIYPEEFRMAS